MVHGTGLEREFLQKWGGLYHIEVCQYHITLHCFFPTVDFLPSPYCHLNTAATECKTEEDDNDPFDSSKEHDDKSPRSRTIQVRESGGLVVRESGVSGWGNGGSGGLLLCDGPPHFGK